MIDRTLSHFKITAKLGEGGMGEVYRATDSKLGREVAIKVLSQEFTASEERLARFEREAKTLAALNHPQIAAIYEVGEQAGLQFLVMELAEGETLAERIAKGPIPVDEATRIALEIATGLEAAHERAIVHRDLKPANISLGSDGQVKILDFGLAKEVESTGQAADDGGLSLSPTLTAEMTRAGTILGTAAYMSPEQARGQKLDKRSDIWAFGVMLHEMLTGRQLFAKDTVTDTLAAILRADVDLEGLPAGTPPMVTRLLRRCLERDPRQRLHDIGDARLDLEELEGDADPFSPGDSTANGVPQRRLLAKAAGLAAAALLVGLALGRLTLGPPPGEPPAPLHVALNLPEGTRLSGWGGVALSPDGRKAAYVAEGPDGQHLYVHHLDRGEIQKIEGSDDAELPFFSPDGEWIAFGGGALSGPSKLPPQLRKASLATGIAQTLCPVQDYHGGTWAEDGTIYFADELFKGLFRIDSAGGPAVPIATPGTPEARELEGNIVLPQILPGGRSLLVVSWSGGELGKLLLVDTTTGAVRDLEIETVLAHYVPSGHLVYVTPDLGLWAVPFDLEQEEVSGSPVALLQNLALDALSPAMAISRTGSLFYATGYLRGSGRELSSLVRIGVEGKIDDLGFAPDVFDKSFAVSPDQSRLAVVTWDSSLWIYDLERGTRSKLPRGAVGYRRGPVWSPDGEVLVTWARSPETGSDFDLFAQPADASGPPEPLLIEPGEQAPRSFVPETRDLLYTHWPIGGLAQLWTLPLDSPQDRQPLLTSEETLIFEGQASPDGKWVAYEAAGEILLASYPGAGPSVQVSVEGGRHVFWGLQGDRLYYRGGESGTALLVAEIGDDGTPARSRELFDLPTVPSLMPTSAGTFIGTESDLESGIITQLQLVLDWSSELTRRVPTDSP